MAHDERVTKLRRPRLDHHRDVLEPDAGPRLWVMTTLLQRPSGVTAWLSARGSLMRWLAFSTKPAPTTPVASRAAFTTSEMESPNAINSHLVST